tara:strand:+ start:620 stop:751 length:132 start_codon:yes stop_codon:yes gene_type:complete
VAAAAAVFLTVLLEVRVPVVVEQERGHLMEMLAQQILAVVVAL